MGKQNTRLLCCGDSRLSFCHINTLISKPVKDISWKQFLSQEQSCQRCSCDKNCFQEMSSTGLEMRQTRFRPGLCPGPHWGSLQRSPDPLTGGEGAGRPSSRTPPRSFGPQASALRASLSRPPNTPEDKSYLRPCLQSQQY